MRFDEYQKKASTTAIFMNKVKEKYGDQIPEEIYKVMGISYCALGMGESGEVQEKINNIIIDKSGLIDDDDIKQIKGEMGDQLWYISAMCTFLDFQMQSIANGYIDFEIFQNNVVTIDISKLRIDNIDIHDNIAHIMEVSCCALGMGESGQIQGKVKKIIRDAGGDINKKIIDNIVKSMTIQLEWIANMCNLLNINMSDVAEGNIDKLFDRKDRGVLTGSGDNR